MLSCGWHQQLERNLQGSKFFFLMEKQEMEGVGWEGLGWGVTLFCTSQFPDEASSSGYSQIYELTSSSIAKLGRAFTTFSSGFPLLSARWNLLGCSFPPCAQSGLFATMLFLCKGRRKGGNREKRLALNHLCAFYTVLPGHRHIILELTIFI